MLLNSQILYLHWKDFNDEAMNAPLTKKNCILFALIPPTLQNKVISNQNIIPRFQIYVHFFYVTLSFFIPYNFHTQIHLIL